MSECSVRMNSSASNSSASSRNDFPRFFGRCAILSHHNIHHSHHHLPGHHHVNSPLRWTDKADEREHCEQRRRVRHEADGRRRERDEERQTPHHLQLVTRHVQGPSDPTQTARAR